MKNYFFALSMALTLVSFGQENSIPTNEKTGNAEFTDVIDVTGASQAQLYNRALAWINAFYPNPSGTIKSQDSANSIEGKARFRVKLTDKKGKTIGQSNVNYDFKIELKDGKYRYVIDRINWQQPSYFDITKWEKKDDPRYQEETYPIYIEQTLAYFDDLISNLEAAMEKTEEVESSDW